MYKLFLVIILISPLLFSCINLGSNETEVIVELTEEEKVTSIYQEALEALEEGDAFYAGKKFREVETLLPQSEWAAKASLMSAYSDYARNSYEASVKGFRRFLKNYPADKNISYADYLIAICFYEQILDEKKDIEPLLRAKKQFEYVIKKYPETDYAIDSKFKIDLIIDQLAAKEMYIARYYMENQKWIPALNRLKTVVDKYDKTIFIEEALHRIVEVYYKIGLIEQSKEAAAILGYNYQSSEWYERSYKVFNEKYEMKRKKEKEKKLGLLRKKIKSLF
jgi:outer membrane protein assembly factor BamD